MAAGYCLPKPFASAFMAALRDGKIDPAKLMDMTSAERRTFFEGIVGAEHAPEVNALFESKLLLKDQQRGLVNWAKTVAGISEPRRADLINKISKLDRVLTPDEESKFLADLAASKLGATVTVDEAKEIAALAADAQAKRAAMTADMRPETWTAYGRALIDLTEKVESLKPGSKTWGEHVIDVLNTPRALMSTLDLSAPFNQGWGLMSTHQGWDAFGRMFRYAASEEGYQDLRGWIVGHPLYETAKRAKLGITELGDKLTTREEAIQSSLAENAAAYLSDKTGVPNLIRASNRAYTGFLNYARFKTFSDLIEAARLAGEDVSLGSQAARDIAKVVNDFSGRGAIGKGDRYASAAPAINALLFAPRKLSATIEMFNPKNYLDPRISPTARKAALRRLTGSIVATGAVIGLARAMGAKVDVDPRSVNFLKIQIGEEKFDVTGGNAIYTRLLARIATNQEITSKGRLVELGATPVTPTRADLVVGFLRGKLAPVAGVMADALYGKDPIGRPFSITNEMRDKLMPMTIGNYIDMATEDPGNVAAILPAMSAIFGIGMQTPLPPLTRGKSNRDVWGETADKAAPKNDAITTALGKVGIQVGFPPKKIRGVTLTDDQYDEYQQYYGRLTRSAVANQLRTPNFSKLPLGAQEDMLKTAIKHAHEQATNRMLMRYTDIVRKAAEAKRQQRIMGSPSAIAEREAVERR